MTHAGAGETRVPARDSLGRRMALVLLPLVLVPILIMGAVAYLRARAILQDQVRSQMTSATETQVQMLDTWATAREQQLILASQAADFQTLAGQLLRLPESSPTLGRQRDETRTLLASFRSQAGQVLFSDVLVVRTSDGRVVASTNTDWEGMTLPAMVSGTLPASALETLPLYDDGLLSPGGLAVVTTTPVTGLSTGGGDAILVGVNVGMRLSQLLEQLQVFWERRGAYLVERGESFLVIHPNVTISVTRYATQPTIEVGLGHPAFAGDPASSEAVSQQYSNADGVPVLGTFRWIPAWNMAVVNEIPQSDVYAGLNTLGPFTAILVAGAALLAFVVVVLVSSRMLRPLATLTDFSERFTRGEWEHRVAVVRHDEVGRLAASFNNMADELSGLYRSLEARVEARTRQIRTAAEVARDAATARDVDRLLDETVSLISNRFNFYHAGIFLIDETGEWAVLRSASSEGGRRMLHRGHRLAVGKIGIVGYVTGTGKARIAVDVGADAVHFANPDLPETRSEMALPLRIGDRVIGALDVQSQEPNAFEDADVVVLQTMADQLAVAIENVSLISVQSRRAAQRRRIIELSRQLTEELGLNQVITQATEAIQKDFGYDRVSMALVEGRELVIRSAARASGIRPIPIGQAFPLGQGVLGRAAALKSRILIPDLSADPLMGPRLTQGDPLTVLAVPLLSRGQAVGALAVERMQPASLTDEDIELLEMLAGLVAVSLENARLFDEMQASLQQLDALYRQRTEEAWTQLFAARRAGAARTQFDYLQKGKRREDLPPSEPLEADIALRGEVIGRLGLEAPLPSRDWSEDDKLVVEAVADEVANALEQARLMEEVHRRAAQLRIAAEIARDATSLLDLNTLLARAIGLIRERFGFNHVSVFLVDEAAEYAVIREATGEAGREMKASGHKFAVGSQSIVGHVTKTGEPYVAHDATRDPMFKPNPLLPDTMTELVVPLRSAERIIGALDVQHTRPHTFTEDEIAVLEILSDQLGVAVQNARSFEEALHRAQREEALLEITGRIRASRDVDTIMQTAVQEMRRALGAKEAAIRLAADFDEAPTNGSGDGGVRTGLPNSGQPER